MSLGVLAFEEEMIKRAAVSTIEDLQVRLPSPEDLIIMKAVAHRPRDLEDIRTVAEKQAKLDLGRIERWVRDFAETLEMPEIWSDIEPILKGK